MLLAFCLSSQFQLSFLTFIKLLPWSRRRAFDAARHTCVPTSTLQWNSREHGLRDLPSSVFCYRACRGFQAPESYTLVVWLPGQKTLGKRLHFAGGTAATCYPCNVDELQLQKFLRSSPPMLRVLTPRAAPERAANTAGTSRAGRGDAGGTNIIASAKLDLSLVLTGKDVRYEAAIRSQTNCRVGRVTVEAAYRKKDAIPGCSRQVRPVSALTRPATSCTGSRTRFNSEGITELL